MEIGVNIRAARRQKNMSIQQLCEKTGLSQGFMSQVENDKTSPSLSTLNSIAEALEVPLAFLLLQKNERMRITRKDERRKTIYGKNNFHVEHLNDQGSVKMMLVEMPPGAATEEAHSHPGDEIHYVMQGTLRIRQGQDSAVVYAGDTFSWKACFPHYAENIGDETAIVLISIHRESAQ
ncbi:helix-turn-helix domain-containing protein [Paenibacillus terreus]|uniref:Helix-turn-helix domain-containing protein n=1 Tax=Paenibacillus terreus TaxID=1387834 RepID=A0ABV5B614_9BACL